MNVGFYRVDNSTLKIYGPFIGKPGELTDGIIADYSLQINDTVYFRNIAGSFPYKILNRSQIPFGSRTLLRMYYGAVIGYQDKIIQGVDWHVLGIIGYGGLGHSGLWISRKFMYKSDTFLENF